MITEIGAVKVRGGEVLGEFQTLVNPRTRSRRSSRCSPASATRWSPTPRRSSRRCRRSSSSRPAPCWSPTTRRSTSASSSHFAAQQGRAWPGFEVVDTARLARRVITRDDAPNCKLVVAGAGVPVHHHAQPPRALRRPGHRRRAARADRAARRPRRAHARGAADVLRAGLDRPAPQAPPRRGAAALPPASTCSATTRGRVLYVGTSKRPAHPGAHLLHRVRDPVPDGRDGRARRHGRGHRLQHRARGRGPRAAADRRAQAALQPPVPVPRADALGQAHRRALAPAVPGQPRARRRRRLPRPVRVPQGRREVPGRAARDVPGPPVQRPVRQGAVPRPVRPGRDGPLPRAVRRQRRRRRRTPRWCGCSRTRCCAGPTRWSTRSTAGWSHWPPTSGSRRPASTATGWRRSSGPPPAPSGSPRSPAAPRSWPPGARPTAAGRSTSSATAGSPPPASIPPGADAHAVRRRAAAVRRDRRRRARARCRPRRPRSPRRCCAGSSPRASGSSTSRASGPARSPAPPATSRSTTRSTESRRSLVPFADRRDLTTVHQPAR